MQPCARNKPREARPTATTLVCPPGNRPRRRPLDKRTATEPARKTVSALRIHNNNMPATMQTYVVAAPVESLRMSGEGGAEVHDDREHRLEGTNAAGSGPPASRHRTGHHTIIRDTYFDVMEHQLVREHESTVQHRPVAAAPERTSSLEPGDSGRKRKQRSRTYASINTHVKSHWLCGMNST
jgi:hypothetical protein